MITPELLKSWSPCAEGYKRFIQLFPNGSDLQAAIDGLVADGHDEWGYWLFDQCRIHGLYCDVISRGYRNSGYRNSGYRNSGDWNSGDRNSGNRNSGYMNSGNWNSGNWNSGNWNSGFFNTTIPQTVRVFGVDIPRGQWDACYKPKFLYFDLTQWIASDSMTDAEKAALPSREITGGFLKVMGYKEAFRQSWDRADPNDRMKITAIPGFNAKMFYEISGIDLRNEVGL